MRESSALLPLLAAVLSTVLGGSAVVATRYLVATNDALAVAAMRLLGAGLIVLALAIAQHRFRFGRRDLAVIAVLGILQFGLFGWLFAAALVYVPAARGAVLLATMPIVTLAFAALAGREGLTSLKLGGTVVGLMGVLIALGDQADAGGSGAWKGDLLMLAAVATASVYNVASSSVLGRNSALSVIAVQVPLAGVAMAAGAATLGGPSSLVAFSFGGWLVLLYLMSFSGAFCFYLWIWALEHTTPSRVAITVTANPLSAAILGTLLLAEPITWRMAAGLLAVILGVALVNWRERSRLVAEPRITSQPRQS